MTVLERIGEMIAKPAPISAGAKEHLALHLLDALGAWTAGRETEEGKSLARLRSSNGDHRLSVFGDNLLDHVALGVATTRLTEIDDIHMPSCTTPSAVVVPTALTVAAQLHENDPEALVQALCAGYEVITRLGAAISGPTIVYRGIWPTYFAAPLGSAAAAARLLKLDAAVTASALSIALTSLSGAPGAHTADSPRWLLLGFAARAGCAAALAAAAGYNGDRTLLDDDWLQRTRGIRHDIAPLVAPTAGAPAIGVISFKPYCSAKQAIAAIDAFRELLRQGIDPAAIKSVRVSVPSAYAGMIGHHRAAAGHVERITSAPYHLALAAFRPNDLDDVHRLNLAADPQIQAFMSRVEVVADQSLDHFYPQCWPARVEVTLESGATRSELVVDAWGDPNSKKPFDAAAVKTKFHRLADPAIGEEAARDLSAGALRALDSPDDLQSLLSQIGQEDRNPQAAKQGARP